MRYLPKKRTPKQELIIKAVQDFWGEDGKVSNRTITNVSLWIMGRKKGVELNEEEKEAVWYVQSNLGDEIYPMNLELEGNS